MTPEQIQADLGVPMTQKNQPDMYNHMPRRFVSLAEAKARRWSWCFPGDACRYGHIAPRRTANTRICAACQRTKDSQPPVHARSKAQAFYSQERVEKNRAANTPGVVASTPAPTAPKIPELSQAHLQFLESFNLTASLESAAKAAGMTVARVETERLAFAPFETACTTAGVPHHIPPAPAFEWTPEKPELFVRAYINSGSLAMARDATGCTPEQYYSELRSNPEFKDAVDKAKPLADQAVYDQLQKLALGGNQQALAKWLEQRPDQGDSEYTIDFLGRRVKRARSDAESDAALERLVKTIKGGFDSSTHLHRQTGALIKGEHLEQVHRDKRDGSIIAPDDLRKLDPTATACILREREHGAGRDPEELWRSTARNT
jgi:hypothetical protein